MTDTLPEITTEERTDERLMCCPHRLTYDWIEDEDCTDQSGCVGFFQSIDPEVREIEVFSGDRLDIVYSRKAGGKWTADSTIS